ncbi:acetylornithine deacetylase/Succinyl-diaminopimelate desuccinylase and related deacylases [Candidatus Scalindua japonica]|uniref:Acetylornithine deacetylase/Succinyl-diaminopimelate desuccinylase and related deacylases n=1 Tax=Candidatus Scalindua japonica TaxID=1284222 RepID=A0A286TY21_9BACT|nr:ArgE/DapE family deacylase [Candidatus Scalindua japonica]GAX60788.1 acetylornithine deacetylase/Succinyl-diaminopimelate desuccinylase and related deacylases [Candidatus Scalindua japonica]
MKEHLISYIQDHEKEIIRLATELIGANTVNPPGNEYLAVDIIKKYFNTHGIKYDIFEKITGRANIIGYIGNGSPTLLVACHMDVVPPGDGWDTDPFNSVVKDNRIFGRGANDNKGQMASMLVLSKLLKENESKLNGSLLVIGAADEEKGSGLGLEYLLDECGISADYAIIPDVANNMKIIDVGEKGALFLNIISYGKQSHGSTPEKGVNAIWNMIELLNQLKKLRYKCSTHELFSPPTLNLGTITGGAAHNIVPARCEVKIDIRYLPGETEKEILKKIYEIITSINKHNPTAKFDIHVDTHLPPTQVPVDNPLISLISKHTESILGIKPIPMGYSGVTVSKQLIEKGIMAVGFGPGDEDQSHIANESIEIRELIDFGKIMGLIIFDILK